MSPASTLRRLVVAALLPVAATPVVLHAQAAAPLTTGQIARASRLLALAGDTASAAVVAADSGIAATDSINAAASLPLRIPARSILTRRDLLVAGGFTAAAIALFPLDQEITSWIRDPQRLESSAWQRTMAGAEWGVETGSIVAGAGLWAAGLATRNRGIAEMGAHSLVAVAMTQQVTHVLKGAFGRSRPYMSADSLAHDWNPGTGFGTSDRRSFPSGHTSHAFAFASALSHEISHNWPRAGRIATPLLYAGATGAALARVYHDKHWASDVTVGAAVGILTSRATLGFLHGRPDNWLDRALLNTRIVPQAGGATVAVTLPAP